MRKAGYRVEIHDHHFTPTTDDEVWLPEVARRGWVAFSHNKRIRRIWYERDAAMRSGAALFMLIGANHVDMQQNLVPTMPIIVRFRNRHEPPFIAHVTRPSPPVVLGSRAGHVQMVLTLQQWRQKLKAEGRQP